MSYEKGPGVCDTGAKFESKNTEPSHSVNHKPSQAARLRRRRKIKPPLVVGSCAIVRQDMAPAEWFDGYYTASLAPTMAKYWTKQLGVQCFVMIASADLPDSGYHTTKFIRETT